MGDSNYRLKTIQHGAAGTGNAWPDFTYQYDKVGNITEMRTVSTAGTDIQSFGYDHLNRLTSACTLNTAETAYISTTGNYDHTYSYNKIGNLTDYDGTTQTYGSSNHVHAVTSANGISYSYDANGNMTLRNASGTANDYTHTFNVENELASVVNNGSTTTFAYDAAGIRTKTVAANGTITDYPFPGYEVESPTSNPTVRLTFSIAGQAVALKVMGSSTNTYYLYNDHLGSTATMSTSSGGTVSGSTSRYYPFGDWRTEPTSNLSDRGFTGHLHNNIGSGAEDIGLVYMNARWYSPALGRFISADSIVPNPANPQSYNRYSYVRNSPLNLIDPTGHRECGKDCDHPLPVGGTPPPVDPWNVTNDMLDLNSDGIVSFREEEQAFETYQNQAEDSLLNNIVAPVNNNSYSGYGGCKTIGDRTCSQHHPAIDSMDEDDANETVYAIAYGHVIYVGQGNSFGNYIIVEHDVYGVLFYSVYAHLNRIDVSLGDIVDINSGIGIVGGSGTGGSTPHIHFEVRRPSTVDVTVDPGVSPLGSTYWATSPDDLENGWLDLGSIFGYDACFDNWNEGQC